MYLEQKNYMFKVWKIASRGKDRDAIESYWIDKFCDLKFPTISVRNTASWNCTDKAYALDVFFDFFVHVFKCIVSIGK